MGKLAKVEALVKEYLELEGCHYPNTVPKDQVAYEIYEMKVLNKNKAIVLGYDEEESKYFIAPVLGSVKEGFEFGYDSHWFNLRHEANECFKNIKK